MNKGMSYEETEGIYHELVLGFLLNRSNFKVDITGLDIQGRKGKTFFPARVKNVISVQEIASRSV